MPDGIERSQLRGLTPEQQLAVVGTKQNQQRINLAQQEAQRRASFSQQQLKFDKLKTALDARLEMKRQQLRERELEASQAYRESQTDLNKRRANQLSIKNQMMEGLREKKIQTPYGEMDMLAAMTIGYTPPEEQQQELRHEIIDVDGRKKVVFINPWQGQVTTTDIGKGKEEKAQRPREWETIGGKIEEGSREVDRLFGASEFTGLDPTILPKSSAAKSLMAGFVRDQKTLTPTEAAIKATEETNKYFDKLQIVSSGDLSKEDAIKQTEDLIRTAVEAMSLAEKYDITKSNEFSADKILSALSTAGLEPEQIKEVFSTAKRNIMEGK